MGILTHILRFSVFCTILKMIDFHLSTSLNYYSAQDENEGLNVVLLHFLYYSVELLEGGDTGLVLNCDQYTTN